MYCLRIRSRRHDDCKPSENGNRRHTAGQRLLRQTASTVSRDFSGH
jgi:hypothetical protein